MINVHARKKYKKNGKTALLFNANATLIFFSRLSAKYRFDSQYIFRLKHLSFFFTLLLLSAHFLFIRLFFCAEVKFI